VRVLNVKYESKSEKAEIYWAGETGVATNGTLVRGYTPAGKSLGLCLNARKEHIRMISEISNQGKPQFMCYADTTNGNRLIEFMKRLFKDVGQKVILILDYLEVHHYKPVKEWHKKIHYTNNTSIVSTIRLKLYQLTIKKYLIGSIK